MYPNRLGVDSLINILSTPNELPDLIILDYLLGDERDHLSISGHKILGKVDVSNNERVAKGLSAFNIPIIGYSSLSYSDPRIDEAHNFIIFGFLVDYFNSIYLSILILSIKYLS